ncbi:MAG: DUF1501 domain-containing protein [Verrucomicrobiales bacterium]
MPASAIVSGDGDRTRSLVVVFLRGGADGLSLAPPVGDDLYYKSRPRIAVDKDEAFALDGPFALNPLLAGLEPAWKDGRMALIHAAGSEDDTRSHFEAQDLMEHGGGGGGWIARFLRFREGPPPSALAAVALGNTMPESMRGAPASAVFESLADFSLGQSEDGFLSGLEALYTGAGAPDFLAQAAGDTIGALRRIGDLRERDYSPANGADYKDDSFSRKMRQAAQLIKARVGTESVCIDLGGWDSHLTQGSIIDPLMQRLGDGIGAFYQDMGAAMDDTAVVVMTEFGRRVEENSAFGTDHGRGGAMFLLGGGIQGGRSYGEWSGLSRELLEGPGDLPMLNNYRDALAPLLSKQGADAEALAKIFPGYDLKPVPLFG